MTKETAVEIRELLDKGGEIDEYGFIRGCCVWTPTIEEMIKKGAGIFFNSAAGKMQIDNWPELELEEPEWKQKVRDIIEHIDNTYIDCEGCIHGRLLTSEIKSIHNTGALLMVHSSGRVKISNW